MLYKLPEPYRGATHISWYEVLVTPDTALKLTGEFGTVVDGEFTRDPDLRHPWRVIEGREYADGFRADAQARGAPRGNFRDEDISAHLDKWGWRDASKWYEAHA